MEVVTGVTTRASSDPVQIPLLVLLVMSPGVDSIGAG
jgi:hypothetical protein